MLVYGIKVYLVNGYWGYVCNNGRGGFSITRDEGSILCFQTLDEAREFYYQYVRNATVDGVAVDRNRTACVNVRY